MCNKIYVYYIYCISNGYKRLISLLTVWFPCFLPRCDFRQRRNKMFVMFQEGRRQVMCQYRNLFMHFGSAQVIWVLSWPPLQQTSRGQGANQATRTPQFIRGLGKSNRSLPEPTALMHLKKKRKKIYVFIVNRFRWGVLLLEHEATALFLHHLLLLAWIKCSYLTVCETYFLYRPEDYSGSWQHPCGFTKAGSLLLCHLYN